MQTASAAFGACSGGGAGAGSCSSFDGRRVGVSTSVGGVGVGTAVATGISSSEFIGGVGGICCGVSVGTAVATDTSLSAASFGTGLFSLAWEAVPFPNFLGRSDCSVAALPLLGFSSAKVSNRRIMECFVAASRIVVSFFLSATGLSECSVAASEIVVLVDPRIADELRIVVLTRSTHSWDS
mgnify:CR=1 FL=1